MRLALPLAAILAASLLMPGPAVAVSPSGPRAVRRVLAGEPFTTNQPCAESADGCVELADVWAPSSGTGPWPTIVVIHGRPRLPSDMTPLARALAAKGAVVFNLDYRGVRPAYTLGFPRTMQDVACGIRWARTQTERFGGRRDLVVLVGHSMGGYVGGHVALNGDAYPPAKGTCLADAPSGPRMRDSLPDGFVHVAGVVFTHPDYEIDRDYFGGSITKVPWRWRKGDLLRQAWRRPAMPVGIMFERHDPYMAVTHATAFASALRAGGHPVELILDSTGTTHFDILDTTTDLGQRLLRLIWRVVARADA